MADPHPVGFIGRSYGMARLQRQRTGTKGGGPEKCHAPHSAGRIFAPLHEDFNGDRKAMGLGRAGDDNANNSSECIDGSLHEFRKSRRVGSPPLQNFRPGAVACGDNPQAIAGPLNVISHVDKKMYGVTPYVVVAGEINLAGGSILRIGKPAYVNGRGLFPVGYPSGRCIGRP